MLPFMGDLPQNQKFLLHGYEYLVAFKKQETILCPVALQYFYFRTHVLVVLFPRTPVECLQFSFLAIEVCSDSLFLVFE